MENTRTVRVHKPRRDSRGPAGIGRWPASLAIRLLAFGRKLRESWAAQEAKKRAEQDRRDKQTRRERIAEEISRLKAILRKPEAKAVAMGPKATKRWEAWVDQQCELPGNRRRSVIYLETVAKLTGVPATKLDRALRGAPFRIDFGRDRYGTHAIFYRVAFERWLRKERGCVPAEVIQ